MRGRSLLTARAAALAFALGCLACDRVPEQMLRDEQARSRRYLDAYESEHGENTALRAQLEEQKSRCASPAH